MQRGCQVGESWDESAGNALAAIRAASGVAAGESTLARVEWLVERLAAFVLRATEAEARVAELEVALGEAVAPLEAFPPGPLPASPQLATRPYPLHSFDGTYPAPDGGRSAGRVIQGEGT
jgi:hypothetical protein